MKISQVLINIFEGSKEILDELENMNIKTKSQLDNRGCLKILKYIKRNNRTNRSNNLYQLFY
jgi:hypothetical protein